MSGHSRWVTTRQQLEDARDLALALKEILRQMPTPLDGFVMDGSLDREVLPDWFTGDDQGRLLWNGGQ